MKARLVGPRASGMRSMGSRVGGGFSRAARLKVFFRGARGKRSRGALPERHWSHVKVFADDICLKNIVTCSQGLGPWLRPTRRTAAICRPCRRPRHRRPCRGVMCPGTWISTFSMAAGVDDAPPGPRRRTSRNQPRILGRRFLAFDTAGKVFTRWVAQEPWLGLDRWYVFCGPSRRRQFIDTTARHAEGGSIWQLQSLDASHPAMDVFDVGGDKVGSIAAVHHVGEPPDPAPASMLDDILEVKTGNYSASANIFTCR